MNIQLQQVDFSDKQQSQDFIQLLDHYAQDIMGGSSPLSDSIKNKLPSALQKQAHAFSIIAYVDKQAAALINCFESFSTFACAPLINIHDIIVHQNFRGLGLSQILLQHVEQIAKDKGCCKLTLEVLENNHIAKNAYKKYGFASYELNPDTGQALFWQKNL